MANLFDMAQPQYVTPTGVAAATSTKAGLLGIFPGTPDYAKPETPATPPTPTQPPAAVPSELHVQLSIPGIVSVQGTVVMQPVLTAAVLKLAREILECESESGSTAQAPSAARVSEAQQRVWDRE